MASRSLACILVWCCAVEVAFQAVSASRDSDPRHAYVTLLYGDEFLLGVRVLGQSIKESNTTKDMVVLTPNGVVSDQGKRLLEADGWIVSSIGLVDNPNKVHPARFWGVYSKLSIFNMTSYDKVLYLDADTIVVRNIDDMFLCQGFCANVKHSERLNSGVMVVEPSKELFEDMLSKLDLPSYTGGDQGFLNSYYAHFADALLFDPKNAPHSRKTERLAAIYNADVGLYLIGSNKWMLNESEIRVMHYTLGPLKPWDWWCEWLLDPVTRWQKIRQRLPASLPGTAQGQNQQMRLLVSLLAIFPVLILVVFNRRYLSTVVHDLMEVLMRGPACNFARQLWYKYRTGILPLYSSIRATTNGSSCDQQGGLAQGAGSLRLPSYIGVLSILVSFAVGLASFGIALYLVPRQVFPWTGVLLLYEWTIFLFIVIFAQYLGALRAWGRASAAPNAVPDDKYASAKGHIGMLVRPEASSGSGDGHGLHGKVPATWDLETILYGMGMVALAVLAPATPFLLGVATLLPRLGLIVTGLLLLSSFMTLAAERLGVRWYLLGRDEWSQTRSYECCNL